MAWRRVKKHRYYSTMVRLRTGKTKLYAGGGENGRRAEVADRRFAEQYRELRTGIMARKEVYLTIGNQIGEILAKSQRLTTAVLLASGYYRNSNTWRRRSPELRLRVRDASGG